METSTNGSNSDGFSTCAVSRTIFAAFTVANILLIPLFILVLYLGWQRWRKQRSGSTASQTSHSDVFTYNVIILELVSILACCLYCCGVWLKRHSLLMAAHGTFSFTSLGQSMFHVLTCVERYVAVVHPITYRSLRRSGGVRIRNISSGCVWLLCFGVLLQNNRFTGAILFITQMCFLVAFLALVSFCSFSVLFILIQGAHDKASVDQSKRRAFNTITAIMVALWLRFLGVLLNTLLTDPRLAQSRCEIQSFASWLTIPGSLVLPLLFLHRAENLAANAVQSLNEEL